MEVYKFKSPTALNTKQIIHIAQPNLRPIRIHKYIDSLHIFETLGEILRKFKIKKKNFKRTDVGLKYLRLYLYKLFLHKCTNTYEHTLLFTPKTQQNLKFFLNSMRYVFFYRPLLCLFVVNKKYFTKKQKRIKKRIKKRIYKQFTLI